MSIDQLITRYTPSTDRPYVSADYATVEPRTGNRWKEYGSKAWNFTKYVGGGALAGVAATYLLGFFVPYISAMGLGALLGAGSGLISYRRSRRKGSQSPVA